MIRWGSFFTPTYSLLIANSIKSMLIKLTGGTVYDPEHGIDGEVRDLYVRDGRIVDNPNDAKIDKVVGWGKRCEPQRDGVSMTRWGSFLTHNLQAKENSLNLC